MHALTVNVHFLATNLLIRNTAPDADSGALPPLTRHSGYIILAAFSVRLRSASASKIF